MTIKTKTLDQRLKRIAENRWNAYTTILTNRFDEIVKKSPALNGGIGQQLHSMLIAVKDNIAVKDVALTCGSKILRNFVSPYSATAVQRLEKAGALIVAKTNMDEFGMGSASEYSAFGPVKNPLADNLSPGGSSGGSAAAVASGDVDAALGSDTGGSVRQPAAFCGVIGLRPTYGAISRSGLVAFCSSLDQIGPMARTMGHLQQVYKVCAGQDPEDMTSCSMSSRKLQETPLRFATLSDDNILIQDHAITLAVNRTVAEMERLQCERQQSVSLDCDACLATYHAMSSAEAASNLARYDGVRFGTRIGGREDNQGFFQELTRLRTEGFGPEVKRRILIGNAVLSAGYHKDVYHRALSFRAQLRTFASQLFQKIDLLVMPTTPSLPFVTGSFSESAFQMHKADLFTVFASLTGCPALSLPVPGSASPIPASIQLVAGPGRESVLFEMGAQLESIWN